MVLLAALTAAPLPLLLAYREQRAPDVSRRHKVSMRTLVGFSHQPGAVRWAFAVLPLYLAGIAVAYPLVTPMLVDYGWPLDTIGTVWIIGGGGIAMVAALAAGGLLSAIRRRPALVGLALIQLAAIAALLLMALSTGGALVGLAAVVLLSGAYAAVGTAVYTINMDWSRTDSAATDYTVQDSFVHLCTQVAGAVGIVLAGILGYTTVLTVAVLLGLGGVAVAARVFQEQPSAVTPPQQNWGTGQALERDGNPKHDLSLSRAITEGGVIAGSSRGESPAKLTLLPRPRIPVVSPARPVSCVTQCRSVQTESHTRASEPPCPDCCLSSVREPPVTHGG
jgi:MFS family permease